MQLAKRVHLKSSHCRKKKIYNNVVIYVGEGNGTPVQYSCLANPMDGGAWWAAVHGVAKSQTRLSNFPFTFPVMHWRRKWQPTPVFLPGESQGRRSLVRLGVGPGKLDFHRSQLRVCMLQLKILCAELRPGTAK